MKNWKMMVTTLCMACCFASLDAVAQNSDSVPLKSSVKENKLVKGKIIPQMLNVRIQPVANAGVVDKLPRGSEVQIVAVDGAWYKIMLPATASAYVSADYISGGKTTSRVQMRYGAGVAFHSYGVVPAGTALKVLSSDNPLWTKVAPPATGFYAYVSSEFVAVADADYQKLVGVDNAVAPSQREIDIPKVDVSNMGDMAKRFETMRSFVTEAPVEVTLKGEVQKTSNASTGAAHVLILRDGTKINTLGVLYHGKVDWSKWSNHDQKVALPESAVDLTKYLGKTVTIKGHKLIIPSWSYPYIVVESVTL